MLRVPGTMCGPYLTETRWDLRSLKKAGSRGVMFGVAEEAFASESGVNSIVMMEDLGGPENLPVTRALLSNSHDRADAWLESSARLLRMPYLIAMSITGILLQDIQVNMRYTRKKIVQ